MGVNPDGSFVPGELGMGLVEGRETMVHDVFICECFGCEFNIVIYRILGGRISLLFSQNSLQPRKFNYTNIFQ